MSLTISMWWSLIGRISARNTMYTVFMLTGLSLLIVGVWVIVQSLAGGLAIRLRQAVAPDTPGTDPGR